MSHHRSHYRSQLPELIISRNPHQLKSASYTERAYSLEPPEPSSPSPRLKHHSARHHTQQDSPTTNDSSLELYRHLLKRNQRLKDKRIKHIGTISRSITPNLQQGLLNISAEVMETQTIINAQIQATKTILENKIRRIIDRIQQYQTKESDEQAPYSQNYQQQQSPGKYFPHKKYDKITDHTEYPVFKRSQPKYIDYKRKKNNNSELKRPIILRSMNKQKNRIILSKWRKWANCILFTIYLLRFCRRARQQRKKLFNHFMQTFPKSLNSARSLIEFSLKNLAQILVQKKQISFDILSSDSHETGFQKTTAIRKLINIILTDLLQVIKANKNSLQFAKFLYLLCKHGNYSCEEPIWTMEELDLSCISPAFQFLSCDRNLQKTALTSLLFFKLVLYKTLFSQERLNEKMKTDKIPQNLYVIGSVLYELAIQVQNSFLQRVPQSYNLGNYSEYFKVKILKAMVYKGKKPQKGELIAGLKQQKWIERIFKVKTWEPQKQLMKLIVNHSHQMIVQFHKKLISKIK